MKKIVSLIFLLLLIGCSPATQFGTGVNITFDPRTIGMQIDDTIMQKNLSARLALSDKKLIHAYGPVKKTVIMDIDKTIYKIKKTANLNVIGIKRIWTTNFYL